MRKRLLPMTALLLALVCLMGIGGVWASWQYAAGPASVVNPRMAVSLQEFRYGMLYITSVSPAGGSYHSVSAYRTADLDMHADITLNSSTSSSLTLDVTFYNNTDTSFYYNKTETMSWDNANIGYTISGIAQKDEIPAKTFKTISVTFAFEGNNVSSADLLADLRFHFVVDKDSIGSIVARTAVDRFRDILNNVVFANSYQTLEDAMNNRSGFNKASAVTYIGNVHGSSNTDSRVIENLFGEEFMSMDLDGDGKAEPITMMIKRENLDNNTQTGDAYTYTSWGRENTVYGAEMTLYITAKDLSDVSGGEPVVVYAAAFTKLEGADTWTDLVSLTKGTAEANNYGGYGSANSFNTDTWVSDDGKTMDDLAR